LKLAIAKLVGLCVTLPTLNSVALAAGGETWQVDVEPQAHEAFEHVTYRLWIPQGSIRLRGLIVLQHGCGYGAAAHALRHVEDLQYRAFATHWSMGLVAGRQWAPGENCGAWINPDVGVAGAFLRALRLFAAQSGHPEVATVPWALWGHSGGGVWVTLMTARYPERVLATFARSGAFGPLGPTDNLIGPGPVTLRPSKAMFHVPMMFCFGAQEETPGNAMTEFISHLRQLYNAGAEQGAHWALAIDPLTGHENGDTRMLVISFFDTVFRQASQLGGKSSESVWWGDPRSLQISADAQPLRPSSDLAVSWLASESLALRWQEFGRIGAIRDVTPPPPPTGVTVRPIVGGNVVTWNAQADIESGILEFRVYGDGQLLGAVRSRAEEPGMPPFQRWNYFDQPEEDLEEEPLRFTWRGVSHQVFRVTTVNHSGLESPPSEPGVPVVSSPGQGEQIHVVN
jgi:pimeloyl-ACP methyl ester carboxylesterase